MKKLDVFELKQVLGGDLGEVKYISDLIAPVSRDFAISSEEFGRRVRDAGRVRIPENPGMYTQVILKVMVFHDGKQPGAAGLFFRRRLLKQGDCNEKAGHNRTETDFRWKFG